MKKHIEDYCFYIGSVNRVSDYDKTSQFIINHVKKTYVRGDGISEALRTHVKPDMTTLEPVLKFSDSTITTEKIRFERQHDLQCEMEYDLCLKRKELYDLNLHNAYAELWEL